MSSILLFGGGGFVGGNLAVLARRRGSHVTIASRMFRPTLGDFDWKEINLTDEDAVNTVVKKMNPDAVVNLAAMASIDRAEREKKLAWDINVEGAKNVAKSCAGNNVRHIFFSTDAVFDGKAPIYHEDDQPNPVNYYGFTKAEAEKAVMALCPQAVMIRISLVLGFPVAGGNAFYTGLEKQLRASKTIRCSANEIRTPVDVATLSECVLELADVDVSGLLHVGSTDSIGRLTLTRKLATKMGFEKNVVIPQAEQNLGSHRAPRHKNGIIDVSKAQRILSTRLLSVDESIQRSFTDRIEPVVQ